MISTDFIIPVKNEETTILSCIKSIKSLDGFNNEINKIFIILNGSTDKTAKVLNDNNIKYYTHDKIGRSQARNFGATLSKSKLIAFIDADVELDQNWLVEAQKIFYSPLICAGQSPIFPTGVKSGLNKYRAYKKLNTNGVEAHLVSHTPPMINTAASIFRRSYFQKVGGFNELLNRHEDVDLSFRLFQSGFSFYYFSDTKAQVYFTQGYFQYFKRSIEASFWHIIWLRSFFVFSAADFLHSYIYSFSIKSFFSFPLLYPINLICQFIGLISGFLAPKLKSDKRERINTSKINQFLPKIIFNDQEYRLRNGVNFSLHKERLSFYNQEGKLIYCFRNKELIHFFENHLNETENNIKVDSIQKLINMKILT